MDRGTPEAVLKKPTRLARPASRLAPGLPEGKRESSVANARTLVKALDVLEAVSNANALSVAEIAVLVGLNRTTTHRLVQTLARAGYLQPASGGRGYGIGAKVLPLAAQHLDNNRVRLAALPHLNTLAQKVGERVNLGVLFEDQLIYLAGVEKPSLPNMYSRFGKRAPLHCCSLGKAILAFLPEDEAAALLSRRPLERYTPNTIVDIDLLKEDLAQTRRRGYAIDNQEHISHAFCVAAPIFEGGARPVGAVGLSGSSCEKLVGEIDSVLHTAELIAHFLSPVPIA